MAAYDAIVIGSGAGGLAAAVALGQAGKRVVVLEQHYVPGGYTHSFVLEGHQFSPGVHYVGTLGPGGLLGRVYEGLGVSGDMSWCRMDPDGYDRILVGDEVVPFPEGRERLVAALQARFPADAAGIERYFDLIDHLMDGVRTLQKGQWLRGARYAPALVRWAPRTARACIDHHVQDPVLRAVLAGQCGDHGMPPDQAPAILQMGITHHYLDGAFYPRGGGAAIAKAFLKALKRAGGEIRLRTRVERILIEDGRAVGVRLEGGEEVRAPVIISNADPEVTLGTMVGREHLSRKTVRRLDETKYSASALSLFFATDMDLEAAGVTSGNMWCYDHADIDALCKEGFTDKAMHEAPGAFFVSFSTLKDPAKFKGQHTGEAIAFVDYDAFQQWEKTAMGGRGAEYEALKEAMARRFFDAIDRRIPGIKDHITFWELGTPLTYRHYANATNGALYGTAKSLGQMGPNAYKVQTEVPGLYMVGASTFSFGVAGATMTGLDAARRILGCRLRDLLVHKDADLVVHTARSGSNVEALQEEEGEREEGLRA